MYPCAVAGVAGGDCVGCGGGYGHPYENAYGVTKTVVAVVAAAAETKMIHQSAHYDAAVAAAVSVAGGWNDDPVLDLDPPPFRYQHCLPSCFTAG